MDEKEELQEFDLDEIMKEFSEPAEPGEEPVPMPELEDEAPAPEETAEEAAPEEAPAEPEEPAAPAPDLSKTVRLDDVSQAAKTVPADMGDTAVFKPITEEQAAAARGDTAVFEPVPEEFIPQEPIVFRPKSRLRELKRKLVAGPERRYYELSELGLGKLQIAIVLNLLITLLSASVMGLYTVGLIPQERLRFVVFSQIFFMLLCALLGSNQLIKGFADLFTGKISPDTLLGLGFIAGCVDGIFCLSQQTVPFSAAFCLSMTMSLWAAFEQRNTEMGQMDTLRKATRLDGIALTDDYYDGRPGFQRSQGEVEHFMDHYAKRSGPEVVLSVYCLVAILVSIGIGAAAGLLHGSVIQGIHMGTASLLIAVPASTFITLTRPMAILEKRMHRLGTVLCGWQGVKGLSRTAAFPLTDADLFPAGSTKMNGVKFYGDRDPDEVIAYAAALIEEAGGGLAPLFTQLLESRNGNHYYAENYRPYEAGGIGGEVNGEPVLMGVLSFCQDMGVDMPEGARVNQAVYVAIDGQLCGVFAITYNKQKSAAAGFATLCGYRRLTPVLLSDDFMLTESFLRSKFGVNTKRIAFPGQELRQELEEKEADPDAVCLAMATQDGLASLAYAVTGARALRTASVFGAALHLLGGILGLAIMATLAVLGAFQLATPAHLFLFHLVWLLPGVLLTEWTRAI